MNGIIPSLESIIGTTYADDPTGFIIGCMFVVWLIYQSYLFLYYFTGKRR